MEKPTDPHDRCRNGFCEDQDEGTGRRKVKAVTQRRLGLRDRSGQFVPRKTQTSFKAHGVCILCLIPSSNTILDWDERKASSSKKSIARPVVLGLQVRPQSVTDVSSTSPTGTRPRNLTRKRQQPYNVGETSNQVGETPERQALGYGCEVMGTGCHVNLPSYCGALSAIGKMLRRKEVTSPASDAVDNVAPCSLASFHRSGLEPTCDSSEVLLKEVQLSTWSATYALQKRTGAHKS